MTDRSSDIDREADRLFDYEMSELIEFARLLGRRVTTPMALAALGEILKERIRDHDVRRAILVDVRELLARMAGAGEVAS